MSIAPVFHVVRGTQALYKEGRKFPVDILQTDLTIFAHIPERLITPKVNECLVSLQAAIMEATGVT